MKLNFLELNKMDSKFINLNQFVSIGEYNIQACIFTLRLYVATEFQGIRWLFCNENVACMMTVHSL